MKKLLAGLGIGAMLAVSGTALAGHNGAVVTVSDNAACSATTISAVIADESGTHKTANMRLVVDDGTSVVNGVIPTDGTAVSFEVGPFSEETIVSWNVFGGGERDYDQPLWNGYGGATFGADITAYAVANSGFGWVIAGTDDPNPFVNWNEVTVLACAPLLNGGGHILDGEGKRKTLKDVSFGTEVFDMGGSYEGVLNVVFHNVSNEDVSGGHFHGTEIVDLTLFDGDSASCHAAMNMTVNGTFNGEEGWSVIFRAGDSPNNPATPDPDTVRIELHNSGGEVYDTFDTDFSGGSSCVGTARTFLDTGNITINN